LRDACACRNIDGRQLEFLARKIVARVRRHIEQRHRSRSGFARCVHSHMLRLEDVIDAEAQRLLLSLTYPAYTRVSNYIPIGVYVGVGVTPKVIVEVGAITEAHGWAHGMAQTLEWPDRDRE